MKLNEGFQFHAARVNYGRHVTLTVARWLSDGSTQVVEAPKVRTIEAGAEYGPDRELLVMLPEQAQQLMDTLWAAGFRPADGHGTAGQLGATQAHLGDMRALLAHHIGATLAGVPARAPRPVIENPPPGF
jgi:hypothetical protein